VLLNVVSGVVGLVAMTVALWLVYPPLALFALGGFLFMLGVLRDDGKGAGDGPTS
jgi:hypothetical protein